MKKLICLFLLLGSLGWQTFAQTRKFENVMKMSVRNTGYIMEKDVLVGYYVFYKVDKVDRKTEAFKLELLDNNLGVVKSIDIQRPKNSVLLEMEYNGKAFIMSFFDGKKTMDFMIFDIAGKKIGEKSDSDIPNMEKMMIMQGTQNDGFEYSTLMSRGADGFVRQTYAKNEKLGYSLEAMNNDITPAWTYNSDPKSEMLEAANMLYATSSTVIAHVIKKKGMMSKKYDTYLLIVDGKTGKKVMEKSMQDQSDLSLLSCNVNEEKNEIIISGEYFAPGDDQANSKSVGIYFMTLDLTGKQLTFKKMSWAKDLAKLKSTDDGEKKSKDTQNAWIYWHTVEQTKDGHYFAIGEQYKKTLSAAGVASMMLSGGRGGAAATSIHVYNMVVLEFDKDFNMVNNMTVEKKKTEVLLPAGSTSAGTAILGKYIKSTGGFDFEFATRDRAKDAFFVVYKDYNRKDEDGKKSDSMIGSIVYEDGKLKTNRSPINTEGSAIRFSPAKPGYIAVSEYFKKRKTIEFRLEKISY